MYVYISWGYWAANDPRKPFSGQGQECCRFAFCKSNITSSAGETTNFYSVILYSLLIR